VAAQLLRDTLIKIDIDAQRQRAGVAACRWLHRLVRLRCQSFPWPFARSETGCPWSDRAYTIRRKTLRFFVRI